MDSVVSSRTTRMGERLFLPGCFPRRFSCPSYAFQLLLSGAERADLERVLEALRHYLSGGTCVRPKCKQLLFVHSARHRLFIVRFESSFAHHNVDANMAIHVCAPVNCADRLVQQLSATAITCRWYRCNAHCEQH